MALIKEALVDIVGKNLAGELTTAGLPAYQLVDELSDLVHADFLNQEVYGFVGEVKNITNQTLVALLAQGKIPLIPSLGYSEQGFREWSGFGTAELCGRSEKNRFRCDNWRHDS